MAGSLSKNQIKDGKIGTDSVFGLGAVQAELHNCLLQMFSLECLQLDLFFTSINLLENRYKQKKELENQLASLKPFVDSGQAEEEQIREFYLLQIKKWVTVSLEEIESIDQEIAILNRRDALQGPSTRPSQPPRPPMRPFILTRDAAQAKVFGAGYPSLATMTVDEWYDQHQKQGVLPDQGISQKAPGPEDQQKEKENATEEEEQAAALKAREWDDWKDLNPRGYGNRKNMG